MAGIIRWRSFPDEMGMNRNGIYKFSRNPMYVAYFICFAGMAVLTRSLVLLAVVMVFQVSAHWIILAEDKNDLYVLMFEENIRDAIKAFSFDSMMILHKFSKMPSCGKWIKWENVWCSYPFNRIN